MLNFQSTFGSNIHQRNQTIETVRRDIRKEERILNAIYVVNIQQLYIYRRGNDYGYLLKYRVLLSWGPSRRISLC